MLFTWPKENKNTAKLRHNFIERQVILANIKNKATENFKLPPLKTDTPSFAYSLPIDSRIMDELRFK